MTTLEDSAPEDSPPDHPQYVGTELADLMDRQLRGEDAAWPDIVILRAAGAASSDAATIHMM
jgi:hypothetical protein